VSDVLNSKNSIWSWKSTALSFLPVCHIFWKNDFVFTQYYGVSIYFESIEKISDNIKEVKPTITVVPRLIEKYMIKSLPKEQN
jgi:long-chain acyl-CoA synthetase